MTMFATAALAIVFLVAGGSKLTSAQSVRGFVTELDRWGIRPASVRYMVGLSVIALEFGTVAGLLVVPQHDGRQFLLPSGLLAVFTASIIWPGAGATGSPCNCFGFSAPTHQRLHITVNVILLACAAAGMVTPNPVPLSSGTATVAVGLGVIAGVGAIVAEPIYDALHVVSDLDSRKTTENT